MRHVRITSALAGLCVLAGAPSAFGQADAKAPACIVVSGGSGSNLTPPQADRFWMEVNREVAHVLVLDLGMNDYPTHEAFEDIADRASQPRKSMQAVAQTGCAYLLQLAHDVGENGAGKYFDFEVTLLRLVGPDGGGPRPGGTVTTLGEFTKRYHHVRDSQEMARFNTGEQGNAIYADLLASHKLEPVRKGILPPAQMPATPASGTASDAGPPVDPAFLARAYAAFVKAWDSKNVKEVHVRHILLASEADARAAIARIQGGDDFGAVARAVSADAASRDAGGDLGWNLLNAFSPDVGKAVKSLQPKGLGAQPVHSALGWDVVEVLDERPAPAPSFEATKDKLSVALRARMGDRALAH